MPRRLVLLLVGLATLAVVAAVVVGLAVALSGDDGAAPAAPPTPDAPSTTPAVPLAEIDTLTAAVRREAFCDDVAPDAIEAALGGPSTDATSYVDGQRAQVTGKLRDIAHEFGCGWTAGTSTVRAWVFAPPVAPREATRLLRAARTEDGCRDVTQAPAFGDPSLALVCDTKRGIQTSFRGLFGDAWLTCTFSGRLEPPEAVERVDRWCGAVLAALSG